MNSPAVVSPVAQTWVPITFPQGGVVEPPPPHALLSSMAVPAAESARFYSPKDLSTISKDEIPLASARSQRAWDSHPSTHEFEVTKENLNFFGRVFGGNILHWHMQAALAKAHERAQGSKDLMSLRIAGGDVRFAAPLFVGDRVRLYAEQIVESSASLLRNAPFVSTYRVSLVAHRAQGFDKWPLSVVEVGSSEIEIKHIPVRPGRSSCVKSVRGLNTSAIVSNDLESCHPNHFGKIDVTEGCSRRAGQLAAAADIRFYVVARGIVGGDRVLNPIVTRDFSFRISDSAYRRAMASIPLELSASIDGEPRKSSSGVFLKMQGVVRAGSEHLATASATMVKLN